ncbi:MAG: SynChlorMet cassette protein ScmD [Armatimonadetes bacterium]|nr:SynChlorMet cassette protein ScmD [Armatimonadota bacterium]
MMAYPLADPLVVLREEFDDWAVLFHPDTGAAVGLNPVGVAIWQRLDGRHTVPGIVTELTETFDGVPGSAVEEVHAFVADLIERGFVGSAQSQPG